MTYNSQYILKTFVAVFLFSVVFCFSGYAYFSYSHNKTFELLLSCGKSLKEKQAEIDNSMNAGELAVMRNMGTDRSIQFAELSAKVRSDMLTNSIEGVQYKYISEQLVADNKLKSLFLTLSKYVPIAILSLYIIVHLFFSVAMPKFSHKLSS